MDTIECAGTWQIPSCWLPSGRVSAVTVRMRDVLNTVIGMCEACDLGAHDKRAADRVAVCPDIRSAGRHRCSTAGHGRLTGGTTISRKATTGPLRFLCCRVRSTNALTRADGHPMCVIVRTAWSGRVS